MTAPILLTVKRYKCPHCPRSRAKKTAIVEHIGRCWNNPAVQACRTCDNFEPAESGGCHGDPQCNCPDTPQSCKAGVELPDFGGDMVTGCPLWKAVAVACPHCGDPVPGLLAGCGKTACLRLDLDADQRHTRLEDQ